MSSDSIIVKEDPTITEIVLNRPEKRNALSLDVMQELIAALRHAQGRVVVISGSGPCFSAGHDLSEMVGRAVADYRELFVEGQAFEAEAGLVADATSVGRPVGVDFLEPPAKGLPAAESKLVIRSVGKTDPATRTFPFYASLANEAKQFVSKLVLGKKVSMRLGSRAPNGEMVSQIYTDDPATGIKDVGLELVRAGL